MVGQVVQSGACHAYEIEVATADWPAGIYIVKINGMEVRKLTRK